MCNHGLNEHLGRHKSATGPEAHNALTLTADRIDGARQKYELNQSLTSDLSIEF
jgi:hypothetical protein